MSQHSELSERFRAFRRRAKLSQKDLGELLGISGNYISMIELGKKSPGSSLYKLFESLEQSPKYQVAPQASEMVKQIPDAAGAAVASPSAVFCMFSTETLIRTFAEVAEKLLHSDPLKQKQALSNLRQLLAEIEQRLLTGIEPPDP